MRVEPMAPGVDAAITVEEKSERTNTGTLQIKTGEKTNPTRPFRISSITSGQEIYPSCSATKCLAWLARQSFPSVAEQSENMSKTTGE